MSDMAKLIAGMLAGFGALGTAMLYLDSAQSAHISSLDTRISSVERNVIAEIRALGDKIDKTNATLADLRVEVGERFAVLETKVDALEETARGGWPSFTTEVE